MKHKKERYDIDNLPISDATRAGLTADNINYIGAIGRMLSLQDEVIESLLDLQTQRFEHRFNEVDRRLDTIEANLNDKEKRLIWLEHYASMPYTLLRHAAAIVVGMLIGWFLHSLL